MLETLVKVGAPSFFPYVNTIAGGNGGLCSQGVISVLNGRHKFLPYVANGINSVAMDGQDVISANFSGCIMAVYRDGGITKVCHISTGTGYGDCKAAWDKLKAGYSGVKEFKPSDYIFNTPHLRCYGLINSNMEMYTVLVQQHQANLPSGAHSRSDIKFVKITRAY